MSEPPATLAPLFQRSPTRELEEVQKVNATESAWQDVEEFHQTDSAERFLEALSDVVAQPQPHRPRFLYLHATFGSGKTHLLKLVGYATGEAGVSDEVAAELANRFDGFLSLRRRFDEAQADGFVPVFLNLLNRDPRKDPPIPLLMYRALGDRLGYPSEPTWLAEWALQLDLRHELWEQLQEAVVRGKRFDDALRDGGELQSWLFEAVPRVAQEKDITLEVVDVRDDIAEAQRAVASEAFGPAELAARIRQAQTLLRRRSGKHLDFIFGLDEIALYIGDKEHRYEELRRTVEELIDGPNPVVVGTGQWSLADIHRDFHGEVDPEAWYSREVKLEGADTEVIVRKRWLQKNRTQRASVRDLLERADLRPITTTGSFSRSGLDAVESYPFRDVDLRLLREVMQGLLTKDRPTDRDHIQGRALLVLVRALFATFEWGQRPFGSLVPWDQLFDLLAEETTLVASWTRDLIDRLRETVGERDPHAVRVAKAVYLLNRTEHVPATEENIATLLVGHVDADRKELLRNTRQALTLLADEKKYAYAEENAQGESVYRLLTQEEVTLAEKIETKAARIPAAQVRSTITAWLQQQSDLLQAEGQRQEINVGDERDVPVRYFYSVLQPPPPPRPRLDAVSLRVLAEAEPELHVRDWKAANSKEDGLEDLLVAVALPATFGPRLRRALATAEVLEKESKRYRELEITQQEEVRTLKKELRTALHDAVLHKTTGASVGQFGSHLASYLTERLLPSKFPKRRQLALPLRPIDDAGKLARFFRGEASWPLQDEDARTLGVDTVSRTVETGWAQTFLNTFGEGQLVTGTDLLNAIEQPQGDFLGTSRDALTALVLCLATARRIQLRRQGETLQRPDEMGRAVRTKADLERISVKLEPPVNEDELSRLQGIHAALLGGPTPEAPDQIIGAIATWGRAQLPTVQQVNRTLQSTFSQLHLNDLEHVLAQAARGETLDKSSLATEAVHDQAKHFAAATELFQGDLAEQWSRFVEERTALRTDHAGSYVTQRLNVVTEKRALPSSEDLRVLIDEAERYRTNPPAATGGSDGAADLSFDFDLPEDDIVDQEALRAVLERLQGLENGSIVLIEKN